MAVAFYEHTQAVRKYPFRLIIGLVAVVVIGELFAAHVIAHHFSLKSKLATKSIKKEFVLIFGMKVLGFYIPPFTRKWEV